ncbi:hypothetical protein GCM10023231_40290 [Olivibacter ginsenosidimutans]|uniref:MBL fold metallo-hydrolase n=1 Tax=Olivibacter ginsenosidimutans TaxID=1176537 RepID=A0ABP9CD26_9SPHI
MKTFLFSLIGCCLSIASFAQSVDKIDNISVQPIEHAAFLLGWGDQHFLFDPSTDPEKLKNLPTPNLVFITDIHGDHFNISSLQHLDLSQATLIVPQVVADQLPDSLKAKARILKNGEQTKLAGIQIEAIPMYNLPESAEAFHTKGRGNGYVLTLGNKRVYVSGDTEDIPEMRNLKNIAIAFICMNMPYTMTEKQAAKAVLAFKPKIVYPYHYRGQNGKSDLKAFQQLVHAGDPAIKVIIRDWYH